MVVLEFLNFTWGPAFWLFAWCSDTGVLHWSTWLQFLALAADSGFLLIQILGEAVMAQVNGFLLPIWETWLHSWILEIWGS